MSMKLTPKTKGKPRRDQGFISAKYTTTITVDYDPDERLFFLSDTDGSTMEKLTESEVEETYPAIHKRFMAAAKAPAKKSRAKGRKPARAIAPKVGVGAFRIKVDAVGGGAVLHKDPSVRSGWRYVDPFADQPVWLIGPGPGESTWEIMSLDGETLERLEVEEAAQLAIPLSKRHEAELQAALAPLAESRAARLAKKKPEGGLGDYLRGLFS